MHVDENGDAEFNMTLLDFVETANGTGGKLTFAKQDLACAQASVISFERKEEMSALRCW